MRSSLPRTTVGISVTALMIFGLARTSKLSQPRAPRTVTPLAAAPASEPAATAEVRPVADSADVAPVAGTIAVPEPAPAEDDTDSLRSRTGRLIEAYRSGRDRVAFDEKAFLADISPQPLVDFLLDQVPLASVRGDLTLTAGAPEIVLSRGAAVEILATIANDGEHPGRNTALAGLAMVVTTPISVTEPHVVRVVIGDKFDALVALAHTDFERAVNAFKALESPELKRQMRGALAKGLMVSGLAPSEVDERLGAVAL